MSARYRIQNNPSFDALLSKEDIYLLVERGSIARGDICIDTRSGHSHKVGELIGGMSPPRPGNPSARIDRPPYQEIRADGLFDDSGEPTEVESDAEEPEDGLPDTANGERVHYRAHPSWLAFAKPLLLFVLLGIAAGLSFQFGSQYLAIGLGLAVLTLVCVAALRFSTDYIVTEERVELVWGLIGRSSKEVRICDIRAIDVHETGLAGLLGIGTLDFSSAGNAGIEVQFKNIRKAHQVKELVRELQRTKGAE
jgi:membrane protein YdbS with pleckstrin-like domain